MSWCERYWICRRFCSALGMSLSISTAEIVSCVTYATKIKMDWMSMNFGRTSYRQFIQLGSTFGSMSPRIFTVPSCPSRVWKNAGRCLDWTWSAHWYANFGINLDRGSRSLDIVAWSRNGQNNQARITKEAKLKQKFTLFETVPSFKKSSPRHH